jgi:hypothetical protein
VSTDRNIDEDIIITLIQETRNKSIVDYNMRAMSRNDTSDIIPH